MQSERTWIEAFACCAPRDDDFRHEGHVEHAPTDLTFDQPRLIAQPQYPQSIPRPATSHSMKAQQWLASGRTSFSAVRRPWTSHSHKRLRIGEPTDFRRINDMPKRRHSFSPLELSIYIKPGCKLSPLPDFGVAAWSSTVDLQKPAAAVLAEEKVVERSTHAYTDSVISSSSYTVPRKPLSITSYGISSHQRYGSYGSASTSILDEGLMVMPAYELRSGPDAFPASVIAEPLPAAVRPESHRARPRTSSSATQTPPASRSRSGTESSSRKSSIRRVKTDVDEAIRELNTIVEERRMDAFRAAARNSATKQERNVTRVSTLDILKPDTDVSPVSPGIPSPHVPAIVPTMKVHARSETLSDIGSAFSTPLMGRSLATPPLVAPSDTDSSPDSLPNRRRELNIDTRATEATYHASSLSPVSPLSAVSARSRISGWLRKSVMSPLTPSREGKELVRPVSSKQDPAYSFYGCDSAIPGPRIRHMGSMSNMSDFIVPPVHEDCYSGRSSATLLDSSRPGSLDVVPQQNIKGRGTPTKNVPFAAHLEKRSGKATTTARKRGLSIGIVNGVPPPPAYEVVDPHPKSATSPVGPRTVGLAY